jgi:Predicted membrane protein
MLFILMPFVCMGIGLLIGFRPLPPKIYMAFSWVTNIALALLMVTIGGNVGTNKDIISQLGIVGLNCVVTCLFAVMGSVAVCLLIEKTVLPLDRYLKLQLDDANAVAMDSDEGQGKKKGIDPILVMIPVCLFAGAFGCYLFLPDDKTGVLTWSLWISLIILYISVGIGMGENKNVFSYMKMVGARVMYLVAGVLIGGMAGGALSTLITGMPLRYAVISASGSGYYSVTGAVMLQQFGAEAGVYGFMVNVFRDFFTVLLLPVLTKIGKSAPIASSGAGGMDSMLVPVTHALGRELGLVTLVVGMLLTFAVPILLPLLCGLF